HPRLPRRAGAVLARAQLAARALPRRYDGGADRADGRLAAGAVAVAERGSRPPLPRDGAGQLRRVRPRRARLRDRPGPDVARRPPPRPGDPDRLRPPTARRGPPGPRRRRPWRRWRRGPALGGTGGQPRRW